MTIEASNLSNAEYYNLNGTLSAERIETLLDIDFAMEKVSSPSAYIEEASGCYPAEDFLEGIIKQVRAVAKRVRGKNRDDLDQIIINLEDLQGEINGKSDYGRDELRSALRDVKFTFGE